MAIKQCLQRGQSEMPDAVSGLDLAIDGLYPHTDFHSPLRFELRDPCETVVKNLRILAEADLERNFQRSPRR